MGDGPGRAAGMIRSRAQGGLGPPQPPQLSNRSSRMPWAIGAMASHAASGRFVSVTKSADMKTDATPSIASNWAAVGSSTSPPATNVAGPPTSVPTLNFAALGLGVLLMTTAMRMHRSGGAAS